MSLRHPAYNASKGAVRSLTKNVAVQNAKENIRTNSIHPGLVKTFMMDGDTRSAVECDPLLRLGRFAEPLETSSAALSLASQASSYTRGTDRVIDAGLTA